MPVFNRLDSASEEVYTGKLESKQAMAMAALARGGKEQWA
jgi:hypothetical protein|tara:strand:- start:227 stop:346 length:120 start_codon:yes stop_codon:yes gene_type:complete